jgi:hypothetical protein
MKGAAIKSLRPLAVIELRGKSRSPIYQHIVNWTRRPGMDLDGSRAQEWRERRSRSPTRQHLSALRHQVKVIPASSEWEERK